MKRITVEIDEETAEALSAGIDDTMAIMERGPASPPLRVENAV